MTNEITNRAETELAVIKKIMEDSRQTVLYNGVHFIFWGILVSTCLIVNYILLVTNTLVDKIGLLWMIMMPLGAVVDVMIGRQLERKQTATTFAARLLGALWTASGIAMFMFGFLGPMSGAYNAIFICPVISVMLGVSYFTSGSIQQLTWLRNLAFGWWAGAAVMFLFPSRHTLLIFALMMIGMQVLPGILINKHYKKNLPVQEA
jgi:hypothetical protein